jgi:1-deoxy-D-xylulose-5-phosphate synthase
MGKLIDSINNPDDLKKLDIEQLKSLASEMREFILGSVSQTGGHLASSLGVIEATIALHYVYDFKQDMLLWDVGHQCYPHKILTGRKQLFDRLRQSEGISGFPNPQESAYDQFAVGHAGTSIPTAIGMALGQYCQKRDDKIVAFVGDASIVNGANFEALNNLGLVKRQLLIVLNDNSMAIDATVGAVANYFSRVRLSHTYEDIRKTTKSILEHLPRIGKSVDGAIERVKKSIRMVVQPSQLFESLNIPYFGPVDGHNIPALVKLFHSLNHLTEPAILHLYTKKGKGFSPAEEDRPRFHSTGPFDMNGESTKTASGRKTFTNVIGEHLVKLAQKDDKVVAIAAAMCEGTGLSRGFIAKPAGRFLYRQGGSRWCGRTDASWINGYRIHENYA